MGGGTTSVGTLSNAPNGRSLTRVYEFLSSTLIEWANVKEDRSDWNENKLTNQLCDVLNQVKPAKYPFTFKHQNLEDDTLNTSTDMAVFRTAKSVLSALSPDYRTAIVKFEAKRLTHGLGAAREKEYVIGQYNGKRRIKNSGAIERFKNETHGKDVSNAGIIAYIQRDAFPDWETKINGWIDDEIKSSSDENVSWSADDSLGNLEENGKLITYSSTSQRLTQSSISIKHFWVDLTDKSPNEVKLEFKKLKL